MKEIFGKRINNVLISEGSTYLVFIDNSYNNTFHPYKTIGDCCSSSWFESITNIENIIGETIIGLEEKECYEINKKEIYDNHECIKVYGYTLKTVKGYCDIEFRNSSNGYYGGSCDYMPDMKLYKVEGDNKSFFTIDSEGEKIILVPYKE